MADYQIVLDEQEITMFLGIHAFEKETMQRVLISATIDVFLTDDSDFYDYDALADFIRGFTGRQIETQEELLRLIHGFIVEDRRVRHAVVHTKKPDIYPDTRSIGVRYSG